MDRSVDITPTVTVFGKGSSEGGSDELNAGASLGRYVVLELLGEGGMGRVYRGYDPRLRREVAIKVLTSGGGERAVARLVREAQAMAQLSHPNVVPVYDVEELDGRVFLAMELVEGETLTQWLKTERSPQQALALLIQAGHGLAAAHAVDLVHRDFKPGNVMIGADGRARVMDFGIARGVGDMELDPDESAPHRRSKGDVSTDSFSAPLTRAGTVLGTPAYMAPEQHRGGDVDHRSDQYAFCVTLYRAIAGRHPFKAPRGPELLQAKLKQTPAPLDGVSRNVRAAVARGLSPIPAERFESMNALLEALERRPGGGLTRIAMLGGAALVAAGAWGWNQWSVTQQERACDDAAAEVYEMWTPQRRTTIEEEMRATNLPYAPASAGSALSWVDRNVEQWSESKGESCRRATVQETWTASTHARADWCLTLHRLELEAFTDRLSAPQRPDVESAAEWAASLPSSQRCLDERSLLALDPPPADVRDEVTEVLRQLAHARALVRSDRTDEGITLARATLERAETLDARAVVAEAHLVVADALDAQGEYEPSVEARTRGYFAAMEADAPHIAMEAATTLIQATGTNLSQEREALLWYHHAAVARRASGGDEDGLAAARAEFNLASVDFRSAKVDAAIPRLRRVLEIRESQLGDVHPKVAEVLSLLANSIARSGHFDEALPLHERALEIQMASYGEEHPAVATTLHNIGTGLHVEGRFKEAAEFYQRSLAIRERALRPDHPHIALSYNNLAGIQWELGDKRRSLEFAQHALEIYESQLGPDHPSVANSLAGVAGTHVALDEADKALPLLERAVRIYDEHPRGPKSNEPTARIELAKALLATDGDLIRAREQTQKAERLYLQLGPAGESQVESARALSVELTARIGDKP